MSVGSLKLMILFAGTPGWDRSWFSRTRASCSWRPRVEARSPEVTSTWKPDFGLVVSAVWELPNLDVIAGQKADSPQVSKSENMSELAASANPRSQSLFAPRSSASWLMAFGMRWNVACQSSARVSKMAQNAGRMRLTMTTSKHSIVNTLKLLLLQ